MDSKTQRTSKSGNPSTLCYCGRASILKTAWTDLNPGRRFLGCEKYEVNGGCGFFAWFDPPMCPRSTVVIPEWLRKIRKLEDESRFRGRKENALRNALIVACFILLFLLLGKK